MPKRRRPPIVISATAANGVVHVWGGNVAVLADGVSTATGIGLAYGQNQAIHRLGAVIHPVSRLS